MTLPHRWQDVEITESDWKTYGQQDRFHTLDVEIFDVPAIPLDKPSFLQSFVDSALEDAGKTLPRNARKIHVILERGEIDTYSCREPSTLTLEYYTDCTEEDIRRRKWLDLQRQESARKEAARQKELQESTERSRKARQEKIARDYIQKYGLPSGIEEQA